MLLRHLQFGENSKSLNSFFFLQLEPSSEPISPLNGSKRCSQKRLPAKAKVQLGFGQISNKCIIVAVLNIACLVCVVVQLKSDLALTGVDERSPCDCSGLSDGLGDVWEPYGLVMKWNNAEGRNGRAQRKHLLFRLVSGRGGLVILIFYPPSVSFSLIYSRVCVNSMLDIEILNQQASIMPYSVTGSATMEQETIRHPTWVTMNRSFGFYYNQGSGIFICYLRRKNVELEKVILTEYSLAECAGE